MAEMEDFRKNVWEHYEREGRHDLAWRLTADPYKIMVSEIMLQQTQVQRVKEKYAEFLQAFPTVQALAGSSLADVLRLWSGLGYNRRGKFLREAAIAIVEKHAAKVPRDLESLRSLPGIGPYTAAAIAIFAFNAPETMIETNVRSAYIHFFFPNAVMKEVSDRELFPLMKEAAEGQDPRKWHWALMDYGSSLKKQHLNPSRKSAHYAKQSKFEGSLRQVRGAILRALHEGEKTESLLFKSFGAEKERLKYALESLAKDGMIAKEKGKWRIFS